MRLPVAIEAERSTTKTTSAAWGPPGHGELSADWLTHEEVDELCREAREFSSLVELTIRVASLAGLRGGELARLKWTDVHFDKRTITVRGQTKTGKARIVPLVEPLMRLLEGHPGARLTRDSGRGLVLGCGTLTPHLLTRRMWRLHRRSGLKVSLTLLRHSRASWWVSAGVPLAVVASWMGHSVEVCVSHYVGLTRGYDVRAELGSPDLAAPGARFGTTGHEEVE